MIHFINQFLFIHQIFQKKPEEETSKVDQKYNSHQDNHQSNEVLIIQK